MNVLYALLYSVLYSNKKYPVHSNGKGVAHTHAHIYNRYTHTYINTYIQTDRHT